MKTENTREYTIDASGKRFGRLSSEVAVILLGKDEPDYAANKVAPVKVKIANLSKLDMGGNKSIQKIYYRHTGYMGHLKEASFGEAFKKNPEKVLKDSVRRMLPKNFLNQKRLNNIIVVEE